ncbi:uncharacterized protein LAJ45_06586 [Morchella importuna]|uniref:Prolyl 4-hydroxylase alpha subunit domain-containing protein n=1 Tax=Morchella conica CCBAS932 TaxID=1392247 RepID=A0A3N4L3B7_9PEZI|nr:uncharacterized protein LAJ45_06586 [Morchella importuna]KAH8149506.1 hypothetical protein LAJ45_06586 [Morchella importuna]RPB17293.1 hypothetical protein P167DRAFT_601794 [Morchella conica CCBAS932]
MFYDNLDCQISSGSLQLVPTATRIDFNDTPLKSCYGEPNNYYALVIDDCFTASECADLIGLADSDWKAAAPNTNRRDCSRIIKEDVVAAKRIYDRVKPFLEEVTEIGPGSNWENIPGKMKTGQSKGRWRMTRLNERLRFLKYGEGQKFTQHCDALYTTPDKSLKSLLTLHLYLNDSSEGSEDPADPTASPKEIKRGGATRFWNPERTEFVDVEPKRGRVLIFQQRMLWHSGEEVLEGVKMTMRSDLMFEWAQFEKGER